MSEPVRTRMILHLGGDVGRLAATAACATLHPSATVVLSAEYSPRECVTYLESRGVSARRILLDYRPWDTATNLTYGVALARAMEVTDLYLVPGGRQCRRAMAIARVVAWLLGIRLHAWPFKGETSVYPEPTSRLVVDVLRAAIWRVTGLLPSNPFLKRRRMLTMRPLRAEANLLGPEVVPGVHRVDAELVAAQVLEARFVRPACAAESGR